MDVIKTYQLQETDVRAGLQLTGQLGGYRKKQKMQLTGLAIGFLLFVYCLFGDPANVFYYGVCALCLVLAAYVAIYPGWREKKDIKAQADGHTIELTLGPEELFLRNVQAQTQRQVGYASIYGVRQNSEVFALTLQDRVCVIIPKRIFEPEELAFAQACLKKAEL